MISRIAVIHLLLLAIYAGGAVFGVNGECSLCKGGSPIAQQDVLNNEWAAFLGKENATAEVMVSTGGLVNPRYNRENNPSLQAKNADNSAEKQADDQDSTSVDPALRIQTGSDAVPQRSSSFACMLASFDSINDSDIILDISPNATEYIPGAINIPYTQFVENGGVLKSVSKLARILGDAGISRSDAVKITGECQPCGGGPSAAEFAYAVMKYLGHKDVKVLDGGIDDWVAEGRPTIPKPVVLLPNDYIATINADLMATYEFVHSGIPQIIDARTALEFDAGAIPRAINIPYDRVIDGKRIKEEADLRELFSTIAKDRPVVVYTNTGVKASMVWFALGLLGYDARIYTWLDWMANKPRLNIALQEAYAKPNPVEIGDVVQITAIFEEMNSSTDGMVKIGGASQAQRSSAEKLFTVSAQLLSPSRNHLSRVVMKRVKSDGNEFIGIWDANVAAGTYRVDVVASFAEITETFPDALKIEVVSTSKYKNLENE